MLGLTPWLIAAIVSAIAKRQPGLVDALFSMRWYPFLIRHMTFLSQISIPLAPILILIVISWGIIGLVIGAIRAIKTRKARYLLLSIYRRLVACGIIYLLFIAVWGAQYLRTPLQNDARYRSASQHEVPASSANSTAFGVNDPLVAQCLDWIHQANWLYPLVRASYVNRPSTPEEVLARVPSQFENAKDFLPKNTGVVVSPPKSLGLNDLFSSMLIEGLYFPFTFEALVNTAIPVIDLPFVACHEVAHSLGFAREEEANLIAAIVCQESTDPVFRYSGVMSSLRYGLSSLATRDANAYWTLLSKMNDNVKLEFISRQQYWLARQTTPFAKFANRLNDMFLSKAGAEADGSKSYGRVVELLQGYNKTR